MQWGRCRSPSWRAYLCTCLLLAGAFRLSRASTDRCHQDPHPREAHPSLLQIATLKQVVKEPVSEDVGVDERLEGLLDPVFLGANNSHDPAWSNGVVVVRVPKTGSTTLQAVVRRIGDLHGMALWKGLQSLRAMDKMANSANASFQDEKREVPVVYTGHGRLADASIFFNEFVPHAFRLTMVRDPAERCMSSFYHLFESKQGTAGKHDDDSKIAFITGDCDYFTNESERELCAGLTCESFMTKYLEPHDGATIQDILGAFNFIGVMERFAESMVVLKKDLHVDLAELVYVKVKEAGAGKDCQAVESAANSARIPLEEESEEVRKAASSLRSGVDMDLLRAVNESLNERIMDYGQSFQTDLHTFKAWLQEAETTCRCVGTDKLASLAFRCISQLVQDRGWSKL